MLIRSIFLIVLIIIAACAHQPDVNRSFLRHQIALGYLENKQFGQAIAILQEALKENPQDPNLWNSLGFAYFYRGLPQKAIQAFLKAIEIDPRNSDFKNNLAWVHIQLENWPQAEHWLKPVLADEAYPDMIKAWLNAANLKIGQNQLKSALAFVQRILSIQPHHCGALSLKMQIHAKEGQFWEGYRIYQNFRENCVGSEELPFWFWAGVNAYNLGLMDPAREIFQKVTQDDPFGKLGKKAHDFLVSMETHSLKEPKYHDLRSVPSKNSSRKRP